jgi:uncharacterized protein (TIGR01777 family)
MRIVVAGGTGFIGRALTAEMAEAGWEVVVLSRAPGNPGRLGPGIREVAWDGRSLGAWAAEIDGALAVVNLAGVSIAGDRLVEILFTRWTEARKRAIVSSRSETGRVLAQAVRQASVRPAVFIQASGVNVYGLEHTGPVVESTPAGRDFLASVCVEWEAASQEVEGLGVRRAVIRSGLVLSPQGGILPVIALPFRLMVGGRLGSGQQWVPWIDLRDEVAAIRWLIERPEGAGAFNLVAPGAVRSDAFGRALARALHRPFWFPVPARLLRWLLGEKATLVLDGVQIVPNRLGELGFPFGFPTVDEALTVPVR